MAATMSSSLGRAFTKRQKRPEVSAPMPFREGQPRFAAGTIKRSNISLPVELISTTNLLAYTAPDIPRKGHKGPPTVKPPPHAHSISSSSSLKSVDESDASNSVRSPSTTITTPSLPPSAESSPITRDQTNPNPLACYFDHNDKESTTKDAAPSIPSRALSHTKKSHQELSRQRSSASTSSTTKVTSVSATHAARSRTDDVQSHPFGKELEQVNEVAEEFSGGRFLRDEDDAILAEKGLVKIDVLEYLEEVQQVYTWVFGSVVGKDWI